MFQTQMIQQVIEWEKRLEIEEAKRINYRSEPDYYPTVPQPERKTRRSIFARIFRPVRDPKPAYPFSKDCCPDTQAG